MNYTELVAQVESYTENTYDADVMATMVRQAEQRIYNTVQLANLRKNVTGTLTASTPYLAAPDDFLSVYSIAVVRPTGEYVYLLNKDVNFIREAYPNPNSEGFPKHYAIFGPSSGDVNELVFILGPTPDDAYTTEMHYYYLPPSIVDVGETWLGDNFDSALLYGTLMEAHTVMKGEADMGKLYSERYVQAIALLKNLGDGKQRADAYRSGQTRVQVS